MLENRLILAPLQGFTDVTFRQVYAQHFKGIDYAVAPFISTMGQQRLKPSRIKDVLLENNQNMTVIPQILSNNAKDFIFLANHLYKLGHKKINWNLGCPHSKIAKKIRGSGLLSHPEMLEQLLEEITANIKNTLSLKIRLGRNSKDEIFKLLPVFNKYPLDEIIIHPRTGIQMYSGKADHEIFGQALSKSHHQFVYNGDIFNLEDYNIVKEKFPDINRFMLGRGILSNPFLAEHIKNIENKENMGLRIKDFHDHLFEEYSHLFSGPAHLTGRMKGFWSFIGSSFENNKTWMKKILKSKSIEKYKETVDLFFDQKLEFLS